MLVAGAAAFGGAPVDLVGTVEARAWVVLAALRGVLQVALFWAGDGRQGRSLRGCFRPPHFFGRGCRPKVGEGGGGAGTYKLPARGCGGGWRLSWCVLGGGGGQVGCGKRMEADVSSLGGGGGAGVGGVNWFVS